MSGTNLEGFLEDRTILLGLSGSYAYGTQTEESDKDYTGICIPPKSYYFGLDSFGHFSDKKGRNFKNTKDDVDIDIFHLTKFVKQAMSGNPQFIELLFLRDEDYLVKSNAGDQLIQNRELFLSKQIAKRFGGFAYGQRKIIENKNGQQDLIEKYGYDTKSYMHAMRLLQSAIDILTHGTFSTYRPNNQRLIEYRNGVHTYDEALKSLKILDGVLVEAVEQSQLPQKPDYHKLNNLLIGITESYLNIKNSYVLEQLYQESR